MSDDPPLPEENVLSELMAESLLSVVKLYFGASAPWVLAQAKRRAKHADELRDLLANALTDLTKRDDFIQAFTQLFHASSTEATTADEQSSSVMPPPLNSLNKLSISLAERRLAQFVGDAALGASTRLDPPAQTLVELYDRFSVLIVDPR